MSEYVRPWAMKIASSLVIGLIEAAIFYIIFTILLPSVVEQVYAEIGADIDPARGEAAPRGLAVLGLITVFVAARILAGTPFSPIFRSAGILLSLIIGLSLLDPVVSFSTDLEGNATLTITLDITPLLAAVTLFLAVPSILVVFIEYYLWESS